MKQVRSAAHSRHRAPPFAALDGLEAIALRKLTPWIRWLYLELRMLSDFRTGHVSTSWAVLLALMDCDQGERGGPAPFVPSRQQLRRAVEQLCALKLASVDHKTNERARGLFLHVLPIKSLGAPARKLGHGFDRPSTLRKASKHAGFEVPARTVSDTVSTGVSIPGFHSPKSPKSLDLSTAASAEIREKLAAVADHLRGRKRAASTKN